MSYDIISHWIEKKKVKIRFQMRYDIFGYAYPMDMIF